MLIVELSVNPLHKESSSHDIAKAVEIIAQSGLNFEIGGMSTCIEGEFMEVMQVVERVLSEMSRESQDLIFSVRGDFTRGRAARLDRRVEEVVDEVLTKPAATPDSDNYVDTDQAPAPLLQ